MRKQQIVVMSSLVIALLGATNKPAVAGGGGGDSCIGTSTECSETCPDGLLQACQELRPGCNVDESDCGEWFDDCDGELEAELECEYNGGNGGGCGPLC